MDSVAVSDGSDGQRSTSADQREQYAGKPIDFWDALDLHRDRFATISEAKSVLEGLFPNQQGTVLLAEAEAFIERHFNPHQEVAKLRLAG